MEKRKIKVVVDTNIFLYALTDVIETSCTKLINLVNNKQIEVIFAQDTFGELIYMMKHTLRHHKIINSRKAKMDIMYQYITLFYDSLSVNTCDTLCPKINDELDEMFLKCAIKSKSEYLISDDYKSGMHNIKNLKAKIISSEDFIRIYENILEGTGTEN